MSKLIALAWALSVLPIFTTQTPPVQSIDSVAWLSGCWSMSRPDEVTEEHWMKPSGGSMIGMSRTVRAGKTTAHEFLQIREANGRLAYIAKPSGQAEATFPARSVSATEVVFEDLKHDFPQRIIYRKTADGVAARVEGTMDGKARGFDLPFKRCQ